MKIDKAIEILELDKTCDFEGDSDDLEDAIQLGIEALKRCKLVGRYTYGAGVNLLPGETEE